MAKRKKPNLVKTIKKISRDAQIAREKMVGKPRAKSFGGKPTAKNLRRVAKDRLRRLDDDGG